MADKYIPVKIAGVGYSLPEAVVTNDDLTKLYETSDEWIYTRTGIKERRLVSGDEDAIDLGFDAAKKALEKSGIKPEELDLIIAASSAPPQLYPAIACHIQSRLGIETDIPAFDITAACSGLIYGMQVAKGFINSGIYKNMLNARNFFYLVEQFNQRFFIRGIVWAKRRKYTRISPALFAELRIARMVAVDVSRGTS